MITVGCTLIICLTIYKCFDRYLEYRELKNLDDSFDRKVG